MKQYKNNIILAVGATAVATYFIVEAIRAKRDRLFRFAAGESSYERTHPKNKQKKKS